MRLQFDHADKLYLYKPESVRENETQKILLDFEIQMDHPIQARRPVFPIICELIDFYISS